MAKWQGGAASEEGLYFFQDLFKYNLESGIILGAQDVEVIWATTFHPFPILSLCWRKGT